MASVDSLWNLPRWLCHGRHRLRELSLARPLVPLAHRLAQSGQSVPPSDPLLHVLQSGGNEIDEAMPYRQTAVKFYRSSAAGFLFGLALVETTHGTNLAP